MAPDRAVLLPVLVGEGVEKDKEGGEMVKVYLASSWKNAELVRDIAALLESYGFEVDAFCKATDDRFSFHWSEFVDDEKELLQYDATSFLSDPKVQRAFKEDKKWLDWSNAAIMVKPCGNSAHLEAGYAKGQGKILIIYAPYGFPKGEFDVMYGFADLITDKLEEIVNFFK